MEKSSNSHPGGKPSMERKVKERQRHFPTEKGFMRKGLKKGFQIHVLN
jgi:hypothetical protein